MKRKLLFVSLVAALSTVGYAFDTVGGKVQNISGKAEWNTGTIDNINNNVNSVVAATDKTFEEVQNKLNGKLDKTEADKTFATKGELKAEVDKIDTENSIQNGRLDEAEKKLDNKADYSDLAAVEADKNAIKADLDKTKVEVDKKVDKEEFDQKTDSLKQDIDKNKHISEKRDEQLNEKIDNEIVAREEADAALDKKIEDNKKAQAEVDAKQDAALNTETTERKEADKKLAEQMDKFQGQMNNYGSRIDNLEKRVDNLDNKLNKGLSLMAAMNAVDFQDVAEGEMAIGAGVGHYGNAQSVAIGVAYAPTQNLNVNMKYSVTAGDVDSFAIGAGASYKFRVK